jgi:hypothetical protein
MAVMVRETSAARADGKGVWSWHSDAGVKLADDEPAKRRGLSRPVPRGERAIRRNTIVQGMPDDLG